MLKMSEINKMDTASINAKVNELRKELFDLKLQKSTTNVEKPHLLKTIKKDIARLYTSANNKAGN
jgi:large subunit ribosomal protein L29